MKDQLENKITDQIFHIRLNNQLSDSILSYFSMSAGLCFYGCLYADLDFAKDIESLVYEIIFISGIIQIILAIYDWYKGKSLTLFSNILFGLLFISWYYKYKKILSTNQDHKDNKYEGIIYILFVVITIAMLIASKNKGIMYPINYFVLIVAFAFMIVDKYVKKNNWCKQTFGYAFVVAGGFFWITGLMRLLNSQFLNKKFILVKE